MSVFTDWLKNLKIEHRKLGMTTYARFDFTDASKHSDFSSTKLLILQECCTQQNAVIYLNYQNIF